jgi:hypothetical protein
MNKKQKIDLLYFLDVYRDDLIINMTDKKLYSDYWKKSDIDLLNKHLRLIKKLIGAKLIFNKKLKKWDLRKITKNKGVN